MSDRRDKLQSPKTKQRPRKEQEGGDDENGGVDDDAEVGPADGEEEIAVLETKVNELTGRIEVGMREIIDAQAKVEMGQEVLVKVGEGVVRSGGRAVEGDGGAATQSTLGASQFRSRVEKDDEGDEEEDSRDSEAEKDDPGVGIPTLLGKIGEQREAEYGALSMRERYAQYFSTLIFSAPTTNDLLLFHLLRQRRRNR